MLAPFLSMVIHWLLDTCSFVFSRVFAFQSVSGFEKVSVRDFRMTLVSVLKGVWKIVLKAF